MLLQDGGRARQRAKIGSRRAMAGSSKRRKNLCNRLWNGPKSAVISMVRCAATKQSSFGALERLDCFASLAMTSLHYYITPNIITFHRITLHRLKIISRVMSWTAAWWPSIHRSACRGRLLALRRLSTGFARCEWARKMWRAAIACRSLATELSAPTFSQRRFGSCIQLSKPRCPLARPSSKYAMCLRLPGTQ